MAQESDFDQKPTIINKQQKPQDNQRSFCSKERSTVNKIKDITSNNKKKVDVKSKQANFASPVDQNQIVRATSRQKSRSKRRKAEFVNRKNSDRQGETESLSRNDRHQKLVRKASKNRIENSSKLQMSKSSKFFESRKNSKRSTSTRIRNNLNSIDHAEGASKKKTQAQVTPN